MVTNYCRKFAGVFTSLIGDTIPICMILAPMRPSTHKSNYHTSFASVRILAPIRQQRRVRKLRLRFPTQTCCQPSINGRTHSDLATTGWLPPFESGGRPAEYHIGQLKPQLLRQLLRQFGQKLARLSLTVFTGGITPLLQLA